MEYMAIGISCTIELSLQMEAQPILPCRVSLFHVLFGLSHCTALLTKQDAEDQNPQEYSNSPTSMDQDRKDTRL